MKFFIHLFVVLFNSFKPSVYSAAAKDDQNILKLLTVISSTYICFDCWAGGRAGCFFGDASSSRQTQAGIQASNMVSKKISWISSDKIFITKNLL